jgi:hypothetical protein
MSRLFRYRACVTYRGLQGETEEEFPVVAFTPSEARDLAFAYTLRVLKLQDFELRVLGA